MLRNSGRQGKAGTFWAAGFEPWRGGSGGVDVGTCMDMGNKIISLSLQHYSLDVCLFYSVGTTDCKNQMPSVHRAS